MDGLTRNRRPCRWIVLGALLAPGLLMAAPQLSISPVGYRIEQIAPVAGQALQFAWAFVSMPRDSRAVLSDTTAVRPSFVPDREGVYVVRLFVSDGIDVSAPDTVVISTVNSVPVANAGLDRTAGMASTVNSAPVAVAGVDRVVEVGEEVSLDGSASYDADGDPIGFNSPTVRPRSPSPLPRGHSRSNPG